MATTILLLAALYLLPRVAQSLRRPLQPRVLKHRLSDQDTLVVVQAGDQTPWVGIYSEPPTEREETTPDWYSSLCRN